MPVLLRQLGIGLAATLLLAGCANYRLGTGSEPKFSRLFVEPIRTETLVPQAQALVATQIREAFIKDGRVTIVDSPADADASLKVALIDYERTPTVAQAQDTGLARRVDVSLRARLTLTDLRTKQVLVENRVLTAKRGVFTDSGQQQAEYQTLPLLAEALATETVHLLLDTW
jgi:hypothetical protein